jgi:5-methylcytosine-specific restriction protein A
VNDRNTLKLAAEAVDQELHIRLRRGVRLRPSIAIIPTETDGWRVVLAGLGRGEPRLELWLCHWADPEKRRFWYGLYASEASKLRSLVKKLPDYLQPKRRFSDRDMLLNGEKFRLKVPLEHEEYGPPFIEKYSDGSAYYGELSSTTAKSKNGVRLIVRDAAAFFEDVLRSWESEYDLSGEDNYSHKENRRVVRQHLARERSRVLAERCKRRDGYRCKVCSMTFEEKYGPNGRYIAEAHHLVPLSRLGKTVKTSLEDMITVCANCHRMLHSLKGEAGDVERLKRMMAPR